MPESLAQAYVTYGEAGVIGHTSVQAIRNVAVPEATAKAWRSGVLKKGKPTANIHKQRAPLADAL